MPKSILSWIRSWRRHTVCSYESWVEFTIGPLSCGTGSISYPRVLGDRALQSRKCENWLQVESALLIVPYSVAFLLSANGVPYWVAQASGVVEYALERQFWGIVKKFRFVTAFGLAIMIIGQTIRSAAMIKAGKSFSHVLAYTRKDEHILVTDGLYS